MVVLMRAIYNEEEDQWFEVPNKGYILNDNLVLTVSNTSKRITKGCRYCADKKLCNRNCPYFDTSNIDKGKVIQLPIIKKKNKYSNIDLQQFNEKIMWR